MSILQLSRMLDRWITGHPLFGLDRAPSWSLYLAPLILVVLATTVWRRGGAWRRPRTAVFLALLLAVLVLARLPLLHYDFFNPDEAFMLASAMRMTTDPVANRSVDSLTNGALEIYALTLPALAGQPLTYVSSRLTAIAEIFGTLTFLWMTYRLFLAEWLAGLVLMPTFCFFVFAGESDFVHRSSENLPMFLTAPAVYLLASLYRSDAGRGWWRWAGIGVLAGALPFGKLQALPVAGMLLFLGAMVAWSKPHRGPALAALCAGAAAVPALFLAMFLATGALQEFLRSYIGDNIFYTRTATVSGAARIPYALDLLFRVSSLGAHVYGLLLVCFAGLLAGAAVVTGRRHAAATGSREALRVPTTLTMASLLLAAAGFVAVATPGRPFPHYLIFLVIPFGLLTASAAAWVSMAARERGWKFGTCVWSAGLFLCCTCIWPNAMRLEYADAWDTAEFPPKTPLVDAIQRYSSPKDRVAVWGWRSELHVASNRIPGTRFSDSVLQIRETPNREYFRRLYIEDFRRSRPAVFVDAVGPDGFYYTDRAAEGYETFPALREAIARDYQPLGELDSARAFVRKDRLGVTP